MLILWEPSRGVEELDSYRERNGEMAIEAVIGGNQNIQRSCSNNPAMFSILSFINVRVLSIKVLKIIP